MTTPETTVLTGPEVQAALRIGGLPPGPGSPFASLSPPSSIAPEIDASLLRKNVVNRIGGITEPWRRALTVLTVPAHKASVFLGSPEQWLAMDYFLTGDAMAGCNVDEAGYKITIPVSRENVEVATSEWLRLSAVASLVAPHVDLDADEMTVFAAIVDAGREESIRALLERRMPDLSRFTRDQLAVEMEWASQPDGRWLCSLLQRHAPSVFAPSGGGLGDGVRKLAARGWVRLGADDAEIEGELQALSGKMMNLNPYVVLDLRANGGSASVVIVMTAITSYFAIELFGGRDGRPVARLSELGGPEAAALIQRYVAVLPAAPTWGAPVVPAAAPAAWAPPAAAPVAAAPAVAVRTPPPSAAVAPQVMPAMQQVMPVAPQAMPAMQPSAPVCPKCRKPLQPGRLFCTGCGTKIAG